MKKNILLILSIVIISIVCVRAETTTETCTQPTVNGKVKIVWSKKKIDVADVAINKCNGTRQTKTVVVYGSKTRCDKDRQNNCTISVETDKTGSYSNCTSCSCEEHEEVTGDCYVVARGKLCESGYKNVGVMDSGLECCKVQKYTKCTYDKITYNYDNCEKKIGETTVNAAEYIITQHQIGENPEVWEPAGDDVAYCLQPGNKGPTSEQEYVLDNTFSVSNCKNSLYQKNGTKDFRCGLAHILYETVTLDTNTGKYISNNKHNYGAITYALRMWMAEYASEYGNFDLGDSQFWNNEFESIAWITKDNYYKNTADIIIEDIKNPGTYDNMVSEIKKLIGDPGKLPEKYIGIMFNPDGKNMPLLQSIELFKSAYAAAYDDSKFLGGLDFSEEVPVISYTQETIDTGTTTINIPEEIQEIEDIKLDCSEEEFKTGQCDVEVRYYDENGNEITSDVVVSGYCTKNSCVIKTTATKTCQKITTTGGTGTTWKIKVTIKKWKRNLGYIKFYTHANEPQKYQKMITFAFNLEECESSSSESIPLPETHVRIECPCDDKIKCTDLEPKTNLPSQCSNSEYQTGSSKDPNMNCILNSCYTHTKNKYDWTTKVNANSNVCKVYCRDEVELYLPTKTSTYAGMQFSYDLAKTLKNKGIMSSTIADKQSPTPKLTSAVIHKKQCTSVIDYENWEKVYNEKMDALEDAFKSGNTSNYNSAKKQASQWIYELQNCNLYSKSEITDPYKTIDTNSIVTSKETVIKNVKCGNTDNCLKLSLSYDDNTYGAKRDLGKIEGSDDNVKAYYCKNTDKTICYEYKKDQPVEINEGNYKSNSLVEITYKNCSGSSCSDKTIKLPNNDYATFVVTTENDFYQNKKYQASVYSGTVTEGDGSDSDQTSIADYSYPVSNKAATGSYNIKFNFKNIPTLENKEYNYSCKIDVYNVTLLYDCATKNSDGTIDLSKCNNKCYEIVDGVPVLKSECMTWETSNKKQYGFIFRSVDLKNLFPNAIVDSNGISTRNIPINWSDKEEIIKEIEKTADTIFTDEQYLEYSYTLTPETIKSIKQYNKEQKAKGGYSNNTLTKCEKSEEENAFYNCKSSFLSEIKQYPGIVIKGNKVGDN